MILLRFLILWIPANSNELHCIHSTECTQYTLVGYLHRIQWNTQIKAFIWKMLMNTILVWSGDWAYAAQSKPRQKSRLATLYLDRRFLVRCTFYSTRTAYFVRNEANKSAVWLMCCIHTKWHNLFEISHSGECKIQFGRKFVSAQWHLSRITVCNFWAAW